MSDVNKNNPPIKHSKSKEEKQAKYLAKKARRAAAIEAKRLADEAAAKALYEQGATEGATNGTDSSDNTADPVLDGDDAGGVVDDVAPAEPTVGDVLGTTDKPADTADESTVEPNGSADDVTGDTDYAEAELPSDDLNKAIIAAEAAVGMAKAHLEAAKPDGMSGKAWNREKWQRKTALAAANAALAKLKSKEANDGNPDRVEPKGANFVSSVNADYDSTGEALAKEAKVATIDGKAFNSEKPILDGSENDETIKVGDELVEHGSFAGIAAAEEAEKKVEEIADTPTEEPAVETDTTEAEPAEAAPVVEEKPTEAARPTLVVNNDGKLVERSELIMAASKFYGSVFNATNQEKLTDAYRCLGIALKAEGNGNKSGMELALKQALKHENEAFASMPSLKKAA